MFKKFLYMIGIVSLGFFVTPNTVQAASYFTNLEGIEMTEDEYNNLLNLAFNEEEINTMDYDTFIANKDLEGEIVAHQKKYLKITTTIINGIPTTTQQEVSEFEYYHHQEMQNLNPPYSPNVSGGTFFDGFFYTDFRDLDTYMTLINNSYFRFKTDITYNTMPTNRSWDIIGIGLEEEKIHIMGSIYFREDWELSGNNFGHTEVCSPLAENTGGSAVFELPSGSLAALRAYIYFDIYKNSNAGTLSSIKAVGDYAHSTTSIDFDTLLGTYTINELGFDIGLPYAAYYDNSVTATAIWAGTW